MHEMSIARNIMEIVEQEMEKHNLEKATAVNIAVGKLAAVAPDQLAFCFSILITDTNLAGAKLNIREAPLEYKCLTCGKECYAEDILIECPECGADTLKLNSGRELTIESIEV
jgi:hydrogenase nickel incorporation protein HypA/HybF